MDLNECVLNERTYTCGFINLMMALRLYGA